MSDRPALPRALRANALVSLVTGMAGLLMSAPLADTIGVIHGTNYQVLGGLILVHMLALMWVNGRANLAHWTRLNIAGLALVTILLLGIVALAPISTPLGRVMVAALAFVNAALALWQLRALRSSGPRPAQ